MLAKNKKHNHRKPNLDDKKLKKWRVGPNYKLEKFLGEGSFG